MVSYTRRLLCKFRRHNSYKVDGARRSVGVESFLIPRGIIVRLLSSGRNIISKSALQSNRKWSEINAWTWIGLDEWIHAIPYYILGPVVVVQAQEPLISDGIMGESCVVEDTYVSDLISNQSRQVFQCAPFAEMRIRLNWICMNVSMQWVWSATATFCPHCIFWVDAYRWFELTYFRLRWPSTVALTSLSVVFLGNYFHSRTIRLASSNWPIGQEFHEVDFCTDPMFVAPALNQCPRQWIQFYFHSHSNIAIFSNSLSISATLSFDSLTHSGIPSCPNNVFRPATPSTNCHSNEWISNGWTQTATMAGSEWSFPSNKFPPIRHGVQSVPREIHENRDSSNAIYLNSLCANFYSEYCSNGC